MSPPLLIVIVLIAGIACLMIFRSLTTVSDNAVVVKSSEQVFNLKNRLGFVRATSPSYSTRNFVISFDVRPTSLKAGDVLVVYGTIQTQFPWMYLVMRVNAANKIEAVFRTSPSEGTMSRSQVVVSSDELVLNEWNTVKLTSGYSTDTMCRIELAVSLSTVQPTLTTIQHVGFIAAGIIAHGATFGGGSEIATKNNMAACFTNIRIDGQIPELRAHELDSVTEKIGSVC